MCTPQRLRHLLGEYGWRLGGGVGGGCGHTERLMPPLYNARCAHEFYFEHFTEDFLDDFTTECYVFLSKSILSYLCLSNTYLHACMHPYIVYNYIHIRTHFSTHTYIDILYTYREIDSSKDWEAGRSPRIFSRQYGPSQINHLLEILLEFLGKFERPSATPGVTASRYSLSRLFEFLIRSLV